ncbi:MAG: hypothetical protein AAGA54_30325 [Myxococcota bacterium]
MRLLPEVIARERTFLAVLLGGFVLAAATYRTPHIAAWVGFAFAGYSAIANDSIQTIGTFITSNRKTPWWMLWLFTGGIFLATVAYSFVVFDGDVSYQRLASKGFETAPTEFSFLQVSAPLFLLILTRLRMPVSTTFLLLSSFATTAGSVGKVLSKSLTGYVLAFTIAIIVWMLASKAISRMLENDEPHPAWKVGQWLTSGVLWSVWLQQDAANIAVYLPRSLSIGEFVVFAGAIFLGLGLLFRMGGDKVQEIVDEKSSVVDVRAATIINLVYAVILYYFKFESKVPMSTTWVFIGLLGGRELAMSLRGASERRWTFAARMIGKDVLFAGIGLLVSVILAAAVNEPFRGEVFRLFGG